MNILRTTFVGLKKLLLKNKSLILLLFISISTITNLEAQRDKVKKQIDKILRFDLNIDYQTTPAFVIGLIDKDSIYTYTYGDSIFIEKYPQDQHSIYEIGSITKAFTASLVSLLSDEGKISLNDPINRLLPKKYRNPACSEIRINDLLMHTSPFTKIPKNLGKSQNNATNPFANYSKEDVLNYYQNLKPRNRKKQYAYSHINYALLEIIVELAMKQQFEDVLNEKLLKPLTLKNTYLSPDSTKRITEGINRSGKFNTFWTFKSFGASEGLKSTVADLSLFVQAHFKKHSLSSSLLKTLHKSTTTHYNDKIYSARGWHIFDLNKNYNIINLTGRTSGHQSFVAFIPETETGVVLLTNARDGTEELGMLILRMINHNWKRKAEHNG